MSNNHIAAHEDETKMLVGAAAKLLSKKFKTKISAKELEAFSTEWHHSGVFKGNTGRLQGRRTWWLTTEQIEGITLEQIEANRSAQAAAIEEGKRTVRGWYVDFRREAVNHLGRMGYKPYLAVYEGPASGTPKNFSPLTDGEFLSAKLEAGRRLEAYETPRFVSISKIKYNRVMKARAQEEADRKAAAEAAQAERIAAAEARRAEELKAAEACHAAINDADLSDVREEVLALTDKRGGWILWEMPDLAARMLAKVGGSSYGVPFPGWKPKQVIGAMVNKITGAANF